MYTSPDEDRSDLFLAGAVYILGPIIIQILLDVVPGHVLAPVAVPLGLIITLATTVLVPFLLIRYRKQRLSDFGFDGSLPAFGIGVVAALPVAAAYVVASLVGGLAPWTRSPVVSAGTTGNWVGFAVGLVSALCITLLAIYTTVKARTAFRSDPRYLRPTAMQLGRYLVIAAVAATALLLLTFVVESQELRSAVEIIAAPLGVAAAAWVVMRGLRESQLTSRPVLITPMVIMAIGSLVIFGGAFNFVYGIWRGAMLAGLGLAVGLLMESRRSALGPLGLATALALLTPLLR